MLNNLHNSSVYNIDTPPRIRDNVLVFRREEVMQFLNLFDLRVKEFKVPEFVYDLIPLLDGSRNWIQLEKELCHLNTFSVDELKQVLKVMWDERLLDRSHEPPALDNYRYARQEYLFQEFISSYDGLAASAREMQECLATSRVVVIGVGGAGSWVMQALVASGVGQFIIIDPDVIEMSNLNRQVLYTENDIGCTKVETAARKLISLNPATQIESHKIFISAPSDLYSIISNADLVVNCADEPDIGRISDTVAEACQFKRKPHIVGGAYGGNLGIPGTSVVPGKTVCWACIRSATINDQGRESAVALKGRGRSGGSLAPIAGIIGNLMAWESLKILLGLPLALAGQVRELNIMNLEWRVRNITPRVGCSCILNAIN